MKYQMDLLMESYIEIIVKLIAGAIPYGFPVRLQGEIIGVLSDIIPRGNTSETLGEIDDIPG